MEYISLYYEFVKIKLKSVVEYPGAFWAQTIAKIMGWGADIIIIYLMLSRFETVFGWTTFEVLFLYSMNATAYAIAGFFMWHAFQDLSQHVRNGTFDEILTKPMNPFLYLCSKSFTTAYVGNIISSVTALVVCFIKLEISLNFLSLLLFLLMLFGAALIHCALFMFSNIPVFWMIKSDAIRSLRWNLESFIRIPISIYKRWIQIVLTFILPVAFISFYPSQYFLQKNDFLGFNPYIGYLTPVIGIVLFYLGYQFFKLGVKNYKSTGS